MKKLTILFLFSLLLTTNLSAQTIESWIASKKPLLFEKLYVQVDRELYAPGDKIWLKVYQVNGITHKLNSNFRNVYVQLISEEGKVVKNLNLLSIDGQANGEFRTEALPSGMYTIRAFTKYLENFGEEACYHRKIWITKSVESGNLAKKQVDDSLKIDVSFLPEGGNLVLNAANTVAFKAIDSKGKGIFVSGKIWNENGDTITSFAVSYRGMGKFKLMPDDSTEYYATIDQYPNLKFQLPRAKSDGICLNYEVDDELLMFRVSTNIQLDNYPEFYFVASHKGAVLISKKIEMIDYFQDIQIAKNLFPKGISKITVFNFQMEPLAERLIFIDDNEDDRLKLQLNQTVFGPRQEVKLDVEARLASGDSISSAISVAVVNKNYLSSGEYDQNIKSYLLLDSELKGAIESPASYFVDDELHPSEEKLDLLMLVHGWRSYFWDDVERKPTPPLTDWNDAGINISGSVKKILWNSPVTDAEVSMDYVFKNFRIGKTTTNTNGRFFFDHVYFVDTLKVMLNAKTKAGTSNTEIILDSIPKADSIVSVQKMKSFGFDVDMNMNFMRDNSFRQMKELAYSPEKGTILLDAVEIMEKKEKRAFSRSFGEYVWADKTFVIKPSDYSFQYVIDYLRFNLPSLVVSGEDIFIGTKRVTFMLDGVGIEERELRTIRMKEIELIDILHPGFRRGFSAGLLGVVDESGLIAIYQKTPFKPVIDYEFVRGRIRPEIRGFDRPALFYSPKYTPENISSPKPDFRPTLYWNADVSLENGKANLGFFTSDELSQYVVVVEGISQNGKICFGTKSFSVDKK